MSSSGSCTKSISALLRGLNTPYSTATLSGLQRGAMPEFPHVGDDPVTFAKDYLAYNLCRKVRDPVLGFVPPTEEEMVEDAVSGFLKVERVCDRVNKVGFQEGASSEEDLLACSAVLFTAARKIAALLGDFDLDEFAASIDFSNGASTRLPRKRAAVPHKFSGKPHVTRECAFLAVNLIWFHEPWRKYCQERFGRESDPCTWVEVVEGSKYFTVPKTSTKLRGACKEPELNMLCQKGIGSMIRNRLRRRGVDLNDQTHNQYLAACGSRTGALATIDLASASDSVSLRLLELLPADWAHYIRMTRSEAVQLPDGTWHRLAKVSSMGNGFTFELESLIFWALASACVDLLELTDKRIGVYGDDIIVHATAAPHLIKVLRECGFETNVDKTFISGPFRESCGKHYHYGVDVTPFFLRTGLALLEDRYHFLNSLNAWLYRFPVLTNGTHKYVHDQLLSEKHRVFVPPHLGTKAGLLAPGIEVVPRIFFCFRKQMYAFRVFTSTARSKKLPTAPGYLAWLLGSIHGRLGEVLLKKNESESKPRFKAAWASRWDDCEVIIPASLLGT